VRHRTWPLHGVQFHPESFLTAQGPQLLKNFVEMK
jgi:anthranilate/para-aminobenzoate synthase component II